MRTAIDTNVLSALWSRQPAAPEMGALLGRAQQEGGLIVCAPVYLELLAHPKVTAGFVDQFLSSTHVMVDFDLDEAVWREAGRGFVAYAQRRRKASREKAGDEVPNRLLVDFLVGAHALVRADRLLTLDPGRYAQDFPKLRLMDRTPR